MGVDNLSQENPVFQGATDYQPQIVGFLCNWCSYAGADTAGTSRMTYPPNIRIIRVPCSGRINILFVVKGFQLGADGVLVAGCHPGDCHYTEGNYHARRRFAMLRSFLEYLGVEKERFRVEWVSASESRKFSEVVTAFTQGISKLGPRTPLEPVSSSFVGEGSSQGK